MLSNMATSLIMHKRIRTTLAKARVLRTYIEPLITRSKEDTTHNRREVFSRVQDKNAVTELFRVISAKVADRPGGYTRILKTENRLGDNAQMCIIELVDFNELYVTDASQQKGGAKRTRRAGKRGSGAEAPAAAAAPAVKAAVAETPVVDIEETEAEAPVAEVETPVEEPVAEVETPAEEPSDDTTGESSEEEKKEE
jgi:large subunit ribosomal protein L17